MRSHRVWNPEREIMYYVSSNGAEGEPMLFSGAFDQDGTPIYEGDVISWPLGNEGQRCFTVEFNREYGKWNFLPMLSEEMQVIGNVHEQAPD